jgi:Protein of unknown function (DUF3768)
MPMLDVAHRTTRIRELNDDFRTTLRGGRVMLTADFNALPETLKAQVIERVKTFSEFNAANDPYDEHDFINFELEGQRFVAKIDYYGRDIRFGAEDPGDSEQTTRVMTIMLAHDY